ncbi:MAG: pyridine nucleotide-disulfide oxidoreductase [Alphaproteobacteria bacterium]|nr:pyridine nucleotide-disulfide oxidoreductase [Alphaproteobacteria bacterium]
MNLAFGHVFADLYDRSKLALLDSRFLDALKEADAPLHDRLMAARAEPDALAAKDEGNLLVDLGPHVEAFLAQLFGIGAEAEALARRTHALSPLYAVKRLFVQRRAAKAAKAEALAGFDPSAMDALLGPDWTELKFAEAVTAWEKDEAANAGRLALALDYAGWALVTEAGRARHGKGVLFRQPHKLDPMNYIALETVEIDGVRMQHLPKHDWRPRDGFALTDAGMDLERALDQANYCIWCHAQGKDSCSKGLKDKKTGAFQKTMFGVNLAGCPLEEKISEMHQLKSNGFALGAFATILVDNPMVAATGHRICNDCMKACIYQKQDPVDIPQAETRILKDVLSLPWGFEVYSLLTRWNPLNIRRPLPRPDTGRKVLIVGLGPAGYTLAHHLMNDGHAVAAIDGLKIEPLPEDVSGVRADGARVPFKPVRDASELFENLDERVLAGFGGVAEYGITVRWDKNFLKVIRLLLERRAEFAMYGGVRFGGTLTLDDAFAMGFDHVALCMGAGRPTIIDMENGLARGVRQASDFLMALQLTGAAKKDSLANLQIRLPVVVIGGGLTAIDTATESLAYYVRQVEKFAARYDTLVAERGEATVRARWSAEDAEIASEFLVHARAIATEREQAAAVDRAPDFAPLLERWGGATIAYRRRLVDAPSYTLNHEEVAKALEEGVRFAEGLTPVAVEIDGYGAAKALKVKDGEGNARTLPARSILVAAGTQPNTVLARETPDRIKLHGKYFAAVDEDGNPVEPERQTSKPAISNVLMVVGDMAGRASFFGDLHPSYFGNVVKAMGSAKQGYPVVTRALFKRPASDVKWTDLRARLDGDLRATVDAVNRLTPTIIEIVVKAPQAARNFRPGQFYRLQNYEAFARRVDGTVLAMEGLAMTGAWTDPERGLVAAIALEMGGSSDLCAGLKPGEPVVMMGPTGAPTETPSGETVALVGGGLGNAVLFSIGAALRKAGSKVVYFAGYKKIQDRYKVEQIEAAADVVVWCCDEAPGFKPGRTQDKSFVGNIVAAMNAYATGALGDQPVRLQDADRMIAIGSDRMMDAVGRARHGLLKPCVKPGHQAIGSINSPMQCMMKEICAQCLQPHRDPETGKQTVVFSCFNQDQDLDRVDFAALSSRLGQNALQEKLAALWIDRALKRLDLRAAAE